MQLTYRYQIIPIIVFIFIQSSIFCQIIIDENFNDWDNIKTGYVDHLNDGIYGVDFSELKIHNDDRYLYLNFNTGIELNLQQDNDIILFIDIDDDINTGFNINGIGADISYFFGERHGFYYKNGAKTEFFHADIDLITLPTVTSNHFEMAIARSFNIERSLIKLGNKIGVLLIQNENGGDKIPNEIGGVSYTLNNSSYEKNKVHIDKKDPSHLRIMSYNVERDKLFDTEAPFRRLITAIQPDILCFQEIYDHSSKDVLNKISDYFGGTWYHAKRGTDLIMVSKYPIEETVQIGGNVAFLINKDGYKILLINAHLYCCEADDRRQVEVDQIMAFIRDSKNQTSLIKLDENTPIIILGDMNFVGSNRQRATLIKGDILDERKYGVDFSPDWDKSSFEDVMAITTGVPGAFTWINNNSSFPRGRLDYIIYSGSTFKKENAYTLYSRGLDNDVLEQFQILASDSDNASDHLPVVADFSMLVSNAENPIKSKNISIVQQYPNPAIDLFNIVISSRKNEVTTLLIYDEIGIHHISKLLELNDGNNNISIDVSNLAKGLYKINIITGKEVLISNFIKL